jgi:hypothetical protein
VLLRKVHGNLAFLFGFAISCLSAYLHIMKFINLLSISLPTYNEVYQSLVYQQFYIGIGDTVDVVWRKGRHDPNVIT